MSVPVNITTLAVPASFCPSNIATDWPFLVKLLQASLQGDMTSFVVGASTPDVDDQDKPWLRLNADGTPDRIYYYANGFWLCRHALAPGTIILWEGAAANIDAFDGGETATVTKICGPMWERVTELDARFPLGVGTLPVSGTVIAEGATGGADQQDVTLIEENLPEHYHHIAVEAGGETIESAAGYLRTGGGDEVEWATGNKTKGGRTRTTGDGTAITLTQMPPYYALYFLRRTAREFYRV